MMDRIDPVYGALAFAVLVTCCAVVLIVLCFIVADARQRRRRRKLIRRYAELDAQFYQSNMSNMADPYRTAAQPPPDPPHEIGQPVITVRDAGATDWADPRAAAERPWRRAGVVVGISDKHGVCYRVRLMDGRRYWYQHDELKAFEFFG